MFKSKKELIQYLFIIGIAIFITVYLILHIHGINDNIMRFFSVLSPFYIGFGIAYVLNRPIVKLQEHLKIKAGPAILIVYTMVILLISLFSAFVLPQVINNGISLGAEISKGVSGTVKVFENFDYGPLQKIVNQNLSRIAEILTTVSNFVVINLSTIFLTITSTFMNIIFGIIISIYMLVDKPKIIKLFKRIVVIFFGPEKGEIILWHFSEANIVFSHFISGLIVEALIVGLLAFIGFSFLGVRYAVILALIITFTNIIPYVGPFIGAIPAVTATLLYDPLKALWVMIFVLVLQQLDGNFIGPKIMGSYIGLDPIWIILSITIGGGFFGVMGVLLAIPTSAFLKIALSRFLNKYNDLRHNA